MPDTPKVNGVKGAYAQPGRFGRNESGFFADKAWEGTSDEIISEGLAADADGAVWNVFESFTGAKYRLEAHFPVDFNGVDTPINVWEVFGEKVEKDVLLSDIADIDQLNDNDLGILRDALDNGINRDDPLPQFNSTPPYDDFAQSLWEQIRFGLKSKLISVQHVRHTVTLSNRYTVPHSLANVDFIISTPSLIAAESVPSILTLPTRVSTRENMEYGWYKNYPTVRSAAGHKVQIEQEWDYGLWSTIVYNVPL